MAASGERSEVRERLRGLFDVDFKQHGDRWDSLWQNGDLPFDKGFPNPALVDALADKADLLGGSPVSKDSTGSTKRKRALVPGCGRGHDVLLLASQGYDAYGLEISSEAVKACQKHAKDEEPKYMKATSKVGAGKYDFLHGDFFDNDWRAQTGSSDEGFDLIYDYTFLSALPPSARPAWSLRMSELLKPDGKLVCVEFPTYKEPGSGGPPFALPSVVYLAHLSRAGEELPYEDHLPKKGCFDSSNSTGLYRIAHWQPERTHKIGKGTDWVSHAGQRISGRPNAWHQNNAYHSP